MRSYVQAEPCTVPSHQETNAITNDAHQYKTLKVKGGKVINSFGSYETESTNYASQSGSDDFARDDCETSRAERSIDTTEKIIEYCLFNRKEEAALKNTHLWEDEINLANETVKKTTAKKKVVRKDTGSRLYDCSRRQQIEGRKRRDAIATASRKRNYIRPANSYGVLLPSNYDAMYKKGMRVLQAKTLRRSQALKMNQELKPIPKQYGKLPAAKNSQMYTRGVQTLLIKEEKRRAMQKSFSKTKSQKKLPPSLNDNMYRKSIKRIEDKQRFSARDRELKENLYRARKFKRLSPSLNESMYKKNICWLKTRDRNLKSIEERNSARDPRRISPSKATDVYERGRAFIRAKQMRISAFARVPQQNSKKTLSGLKNFQMIVTKGGHQSVEVELSQCNLTP